MIFFHFSFPSSFFFRQIGVLILNFIGDAIANLFLSGMFVRRLYKHIRSTQSSTPQNQMIEYIARKSLTCLALTFFVNLAMNLLKVTTFIGEYSDVSVNRNLIFSSKNEYLSAFPCRPSLSFSSWPNRRSLWKLCGWTTSSRLQWGAHNVGNRPVKSKNGTIRIHPKNAVDYLNLEPSTLCHWKNAIRQVMCIERIPTPIPTILISPLIQPTPLLRLVVDGGPILWTILLGCGFLSTLLSLPLNDQQQDMETHRHSAKDPWISLVMDLTLQIMLLLTPPHRLSYNHRV